MNYKMKLGVILTIFSVLILAIVPSLASAYLDSGDGGGSRLIGVASHRADWFPDDPNIYVEVTLYVYDTHCSYTYEIGTTWNTISVYNAETSLKYDSPEEGIITATVHRRFGYLVIFWPVVVDIKCQVHYNENTGLVYFSEIIRDNAAEVAQALMENTPWDQLG
ncbi:MAG: hypothetical protein GF311_15040 [Candidatus Lokiarchaeota archaeon]|nr:hypothetical protein [Candidatus Lokiarchaeota archaeon]